MGRSCRHSDADNDKACKEEREETNEEGNEERKFRSISGHSNNTVIVPHQQLHPHNPSTLLGELSQESPYDLSQLPELRLRIRRHVHSVIQQCLSPQQSKAYMEAMEKCPELVFQETDPLQFVRYCKYGSRPTGAAQRLCSYWTERKLLFGSQKAFLPLVLINKSGAMDEDDLVTLRAAFPAMLLPTVGGLHCFFLEPKWKVVGTSMDNVLRACFYLFTTMAEDDRTQVEGIHCLFVISTPRGPDVDWDFMHRIFYLMAQVFPVRLKKVHLIGIPQQRRPLAVVDLMKRATKIAGEYMMNGADGDWLLPKSKMQFYLESKPKTILDELVKEENGLTARGIPLSLGGEWSLRDCSQWCRERMMTERSCHNMQNWHQHLYHQDPRALAYAGVTRARESAVHLPGGTTAAARTELPPPPPVGGGLLAGGHDHHPPPAVLCFLSAASAFEAVGAYSCNSNSSLSGGRNAITDLLFTSQSGVAAGTPPATACAVSTITAAGVQNSHGGGGGGLMQDAGGLSFATTSTPTAAVAAAAAAAVGRSAAAAFFQHHSAATTTPPPSEPESEQEKVTKRRMGNLISSRRKRERQREHIRLLKEESSQLTTQHERLWREQARLQALHRQIVTMEEQLNLGLAEPEKEEEEEELSEYKHGDGVIMF